MKSLFFRYTTFTVLFCLLLTSCKFNSRHKPEPIDYFISEKTVAAKGKFFELSIDSFYNDLYIKLRVTGAISKFPFPKDKAGQSLSGTALRFQFLANNKVIQGAGLDVFSPQNNYFGYNKWLSKEISYSTDTFDLKAGEIIEFKVPLYAFHKLRAGLQEIELHCFQNVFCSESKFEKTFIDVINNDTLVKQIRNYSRVSLLSFKAKFKVQMPEILKTTVYGYGIELRNDSVYSPAGMDNTIWNSSYPDVYWTIDFPQNDFYCSSDYQKSTANYDAKDTFCLFHYTPNDSISIGVWDHDNLSRDDYISYKTFSLNQFPDKRKKRMRYDNLKSIELLFDKTGCINK